MGIGTAIKSLWNSETIEDNTEIIMINPLFAQAWANEEAMRALHSKVVNKEPKTADIERE